MPKPIHPEFERGFDRGRADLAADVRALLKDTAHGTPTYEGSVSFRRRLRRLVVDARHGNPVVTFCGRDLDWSGPGAARLVDGGVTRVRLRHRDGDKWQASDANDEAHPGWWDADPQEALDKLEVATRYEHRRLGNLLRGTD